MIDLLSGAPHLTLQLEQRVAAPGDEVRGRLLMSSETEREVRRGAVYQRFEEE